MSEQIAVRLPDRLAADLDALVSTGRFDSRAEAVRAALEAMIDAERRRAIGEAIVRGYELTPQDDDEVAAATDAAIKSIHEEPW